MIDATKTLPTVPSVAATKTGASENPPAEAYVAPSATSLGNLEQVQAGQGHYYDGPNRLYFMYR